MAQTTKRALAASLKKLLAEKPLNKITIMDIAQDCGVNRQTFYYHFQDIYDLVDWIYTQEASQALGGKKTDDDWQQGFLQILEYLLENRAFVTNTCHSLSREHLENYLHREIYNLLLAFVREKAGDIPIRSADMEFIANFYKYAFSGFVVDWINSGMRESPSNIVHRLSIIATGGIARALEKFRADRLDETCH